MLRNKEARNLLLVLCIVSLAAVALTAVFSMAAAATTFAACGLLIGCSLYFTALRYREMEKLSGYLRRISGGDYSLDVRDNREGELSILKNEIYKVTLMLSRQSTLLQRDKIRLTDAISDISHQLKTPLTSMLVMTDLLSDAKLPEDKRIEFTLNIRIQLERMEWLVSSLLKLSKIDAETVRFKEDKVAVKDLVEKALGPLLIPMDIKEQSVIIDGDQTVSFTGDLNWTAEALVNILKNCVEHTPAGGTISVSFSENALFTEIIITDNGKGIPKGDIPYVFKRFYKGKDAGEESVGIGLAMAHSIITSQKGHINVSSDKGKGTRFHIKFYKQII
ncbi:MAG: HAMP domain-containing sensor histidine kinase [Firmicutes bacterium]|nr:HAMP domain-containing sensor histidine kinase [Bacillota bacterium]